MRKKILSSSGSNLALKIHDPECESGDEITIKEKSVLGFGSMFSTGPSSSSFPTEDNANEFLVDTNTSTDTDDGPNTYALPCDPDNVGVKPALMKENPEQFYLASI